MRIDRDKLKLILEDYLTEEQAVEIIERIDDEDNDEEDLIEKKDDKRFNEKGY